jgi:hypothetical protein
MTTIAGRFVIDADDDHGWYRVIVCAITVQRQAPVVFTPSGRFRAGAVRHRFENPLLRNIAEQRLDRCQRIFVVSEHSSAQLGDRELVREDIREDIVEERGTGAVGEVLVEFAEMRG